MSATRDLLDFAATARWPTPSAALLADTLAVGAAGSINAAGVRAAAAAWGSGSEVRVLASDMRLPAPSAAFVNGFQIHCLEWDAVHEPAVVHALSVVTAALLAASDRAGGSDPAKALEALAIGVDVAAGLGIAADSPLAFFRPAIAGTIGAALAVARLEGLPREDFDDVLGLAHAACAGTMQAHVEGSIALPLQIATAAHAAVCAVDLVKAGLTGPHDALEGAFGHFALFDRGELGRYTRDLGRVWRIDEVSVKPFPSGRASHGVLGALAGVGADVRAIECHAPPLVERLVGRPLIDAMTPAYARLCLPFLVALMLTDGRIDPRRFTTESFADSELRALAGRVRVIVDGNADPNALSPQRVVLTLENGERIERDLRHTLGSPEAPLSQEQAEAKYALARELAGPDCDPRIFDDPLAYFTEPR